MAATIEDLWNQALRRIGYPTPVGYAYEGSMAARVGLEVYGQTRDALLMDWDWDFARQAAALKLLKTAPVGGYGFMTPWTTAFPPPPWIYEYGYPVGCLMVRSVRPIPVAVPEFDPQPNIFVLADDGSLTPPAKVVLTNLPNAMAVYTAQVTDPTQWNPAFTDSLVDALAVRFQQALNAEPQADKERAEEEAQSAGIAIGRRG
jgi:hypothetical protein